MTTVFLGDTFSLGEPLYLGRPIANRTLVRSILLCNSVTQILAIGGPAQFRSLNLPNI